MLSAMFSRLRRSLILVKDIQKWQAVTNDCLSVNSKRCKSFYKHKPWPNDWLPFKWERPEDVPGYFVTDDPPSTEGMPKYDPNRLQPKFEAIEELKNAPEDVRKLFTIGNLPRREVLDLIVSEVQKQFQRHVYDDYSPEIKVVRYTLKIRNLRDILRQHPNSARFKRLVVEFNGKRKRWLKILYRTDKERYDRLVEELNLMHTPSPPGFSETERLERKRELRRLTAQYCENIRKEKLNAYHEKLKSEQVKFEKEKEETEQWIAETLKKFDLKDPRCGEIV
ncbi:28S ribosomal protein S15-like protein [Leptotrombidium deliense]|uniref:Small ribosomal subunit protein uS15m n=1 Tax=Leptotrombidium deliense TaxID=299467 RepID=A0A443S5W0_9ACAR|nr:28S ribosomal protein S15-like protein [Leptotrombidium deliense]